MVVLCKNLPQAPMGKMQEHIKPDGLIARKRFVILYHQIPAGSERSHHWDLMLEQAEELETWELLEVPEIGDHVSARRLPPHRKSYLDYEGEISDGRGSVTRVAAGWYTEDGGRAELSGDRRERRLRLNIESHTTAVEWGKEICVAFSKRDKQLWNLEFKA